MLLLNISLFFSFYDSESAIHLWHTISYCFVHKIHTSQLSGKHMMYTVHKHTLYIHHVWMVNTILNYAYFRDNFKYSQSPGHVALHFIYERKIEENEKTSSRFWMSCLFYASAFIICLYNNNIIQWTDMGLLLSRDQGWIKSWIISIVAPFW